MAKLFAWAPNVEVLILARFVQGFAGGWAMVVGRAVIVDLATGARLGRPASTGFSDDASTRWRKAV